MRAAVASGGETKAPAVQLDTTESNSIRGFQRIEQSMQEETKNRVNLFKRYEADEYVQTGHSILAAWHFSSERLARRPRRFREWRLGSLGGRGLECEYWVGFIVFDGINYGEWHHCDTPVFDIRKRHAE